MADAPTTPKQYFEEKIAKKLQDKPDISKAVNSVYEFNITGDNGGVWTVDLTKEPGGVHRDCQVHGDRGHGRLHEHRQREDEPADGVHERQAEDQGRHGSCHEAAEGDRVAPLPARPPCPARSQAFASST